MRFCFLLSLSLILAIFSTASETLAAELQEEWNLNDVSYLFPLPRISEEMNALLGASGRGSSGTLLPFRIFEKTENPTPLEIEREKIYSRLRVVGIRLDPEASEVRMVWQPLTKLPHEWTTEDAAVHTFYKLTPDRFQALRIKLHSIRENESYKNILLTKNLLPLQIHPLMKDPRVGASFRNAIKKIFLEECGEKTLTQITTMQITNKNSWWRFTGFTVDGAILTPLLIPRINEPFENLFNDSMGENSSLEMKGAINPYFKKSEDDLRSILLGGHPANPNVDRPSYEASLSIIHRIENPKIHTSKTIDCAHCHVAAPTRLWLENLPNLEIPGVTDRDRFINPDSKKYNLTNRTSSGKSTKNFRMFGYFGSEPAIAPRVIHESALSADYMNRH